MYKVVIIKGETLTSKTNSQKSFDVALNKFYAENPDIKVIHIKYFVTNIDDYTAIITYRKVKNERNKF